MTWKDWLIICLMLTCLAVFFLRDGSGSSEVRIKTNTIKQIVTLPPVKIMEHVTNEIIRTNTFVIFVTDELNKYRTLPGWIASSNRRIYAGLYQRAWSVEYDAPADYKNRVTVWAGSGLGVSFQRDVGRLGGGVLVIYDDKFRAYLGGHYKF